MKKAALIGIVLSFSLVAPQLALADQSTDALIATLQQQIAELTTQLAALQKSPDSGQSWCHTFSTNLHIGDRNEEVSALQFALQKEGFRIDAGELAGETNYDVGTFGESTASAVTGFQEKYRDEVLTPNGLQHGTGYVGKSTRAKLNQLYGCGAVTTTAPQIHSISPQSGPVGTQVTLTGAGFNISPPPPPPGCGVPPYPCDPLPPNPSIVHFGPATINAISYDGKNLSFVAPDGYTPTCGNTAKCEMYAMISPGTYKVSVSNANGMSNSVTFTVTSSSVQSSVQILSPNGGETWTKGTTQTIQWKDNTPIPVCPVGAACSPPAPRYYDIQLVPYYPPCPPGQGCPAIALAPYTIAKNVYGFSYGWSVGKYRDVLGTGAGGIAPDGSYAVQVCQTGTGICDSSDGYFKIVGGSTSGNLPPTINGVSGPSVLQVSETGKWEVTAFDPEQGPLAYSAVWGDELPQTTSERMIPSAPGVAAQTATFTHVYSKAGAYRPTFTVTDNGGLSAKTSVSVTVSGSASGNNPPTIIGVPAVPASLNVGQTLSFGWSATDADGDNLSWSVSWGDGSGIAGACQSPNPQNRQGWNFNTAHAWANPGTYTVTATVGDCRGGSDQNVFPVTVSGPTVSSLRVLSPNGGEVWAIGSTHTIQWSSSNAPTVMVDLIRPGFEYHLTGPTGDVPNNGFLTVTVPSILNGVSVYAAPDYRIRVMYRINAVPVAEDQSDAPFGIIGGATLPDLKVVDITINPTTIRGNQLFTPTYVVQNDSTVDVTTPFQVIDGGAGQTVSSLRAGATVAVVGPAIGLSLPGNNTLAGRVDFNNTVAESNESNNDFSKVFFVLPTYEREGDIVLNHWETVKLNNGLILYADGANVYGQTPYTAQFRVFDANDNYREVLATNTLGTGEGQTVSVGTRQAQVTVKSFEVRSPGNANWAVYANVSSGPFVAPSITVLSPNGGEVWRVGSTQTIRWSSAGNIPIVDITTTNVPSTYIASSIPNTGSYTWTIPTNFPAGQYRFRIAEPTGGSGKGIDDSDMPFTVTSVY